MSDPSWMDSALCAQTDPEMFFPEKGGSTKNAKQTCMACEVRTECAEYAAVVDAELGMWGVWAGKSVEDRREDSTASDSARQRNAERAADRDRELFEASTRAMAAGWKLAEIAAEIGTTTSALETARVRHRRRLSKDSAA